MVPLVSPDFPPNLSHTHTHTDTRNRKMILIKVKTQEKKHEVRHNTMGGGPVTTLVFMLVGKVLED